MVEQIGIAVCGVTAVFLSQDKRESWRKWACVFGLAGQPFWAYATYEAQQWGILFLCLIYTYSWWRGVRTYWWPKLAAGGSSQAHAIVVPSTTEARSK